MLSLCASPVLSASQVLLSFSQPPSGSCFAVIICFLEKSTGVWRGSVTSPSCPSWWLVRPVGQDCEITCRNPTLLPVASCASSPLTFTATVCAHHALRLLFSGDCGRVVLSRDFEAVCPEFKFQLCHCLFLYSSCFLNVSFCVFSPSQICV